MAIVHLRNMSSQSRYTKKEIKLVLLCVYVCVCVRVCDNVRAYAYVYRMLKETKIKRQGKARKGYRKTEFPFLVLQ